MKKTLAVLAGVMVINGVMAENPFLQLSLTPDVALYGRAERIEGLALSIWGENPQSALAIGFVNGSTGDSVGLSIGLLNYAENYTGVQWAFINYAGGDFLGWQTAFVNYTDGSLRGLQTGWVNYADTLNGVQIGFVNYAASVKAGVQIGVLNIMPENAWFSGLPDELAPGMIFVNWHF